MKATRKISLPATIEELYADNVRCLKGGLDIGFCNGYAAAYRVMKAAADKIPATAEAAKILIAALAEAEVREVEYNLAHLDRYIA